jgi:hypothetical protein
MRDWLDAQLAAGLPAFQGTTVSGTVAVKQELLTELLTKWLVNVQPGAAQIAAVDVERAKGFIKSAVVRAEPGTVLVDFTIAI